MASSNYPELPRERVLAALDGDRAAFTELYRCYGATVRSSTAMAIRFRSDLVAHLEDIVAEIWARFLADGCKRLRSYDPERGPFGYYLRMRTYAMARMLAAQYVRAAKTVELDDPFLALFGKDELEGRVLSRDALERLHQAVQQRLPEADQAIFEHVFVRGEKILEVGDLLGMSRDAVYRRSHRLKDKIQKIADELFASDSPTDAGAGRALVVMLVAFAAASDGNLRQNAHVSIGDVRSGPTAGIEAHDHASPTRDR